jgi:hypothetical protein
VADASLFASEVTKLLRQQIPAKGPRPSDDQPNGCSFSDDAFPFKVALLTGASASSSCLIASGKAICYTIGGEEFFDDDISLGGVSIEAV